MKMRRESSCLLKESMILEFQLTRQLQSLFGDSDVVVDVLDEFVERVVVFLRSDESRDGHAHLPSVEILLEVVENVSLDRPLGVVVKRIPANGDDHRMNGKIIDFGPSEEDPSLDFIRQQVDDLIGEVGRRNPQIFASATESANHFAGSEKWQMSIHLGRRKRRRSWRAKGSGARTRDSTKDGIGDEFGIKIRQMKGR